MAKEKDLQGRPQRKVPALRDQREKKHALHKLEERLDKIKKLLKNAA